MFPGLTVPRAKMTVTALHGTPSIRSFWVSDVRLRRIRAGDRENVGKGKAAASCRRVKTGRIEEECILRSREGAEEVGGREGQKSAVSQSKNQQSRIHVRVPSIYRYRLPDFSNPRQ
jgi:hypothetical protein